MIVANVAKQYPSDETHYKESHKCYHVLEHSKSRRPTLENRRRVFASTSRGRSQSSRRRRLSRRRKLFAVALHLANVPVHRIELVPHDVPEVCCVLERFRRDSSACAEQALAECAEQLVVGELVKLKNAVYVSFETSRSQGPGDVLSVFMLFFAPSRCVRARGDAHGNASWFDVPRRSAPSRKHASAEADEQQKKRDDGDEATKMSSLMVARGVSWWFTRRGQKFRGWVGVRHGEVRCAARELVQYDASCYIRNTRVTRDRQLSGVYFRLRGGLRLIRGRYLSLRARSATSRSVSFHPTRCESPSRAHSIRHRRTVDVSIEVTRLRIILARKMSLSVVYPHMPFTHRVASLLCGRHRSTYLAKRLPRAAILQSRLAWPPPRLRARARVQFSPGSGAAVRSRAPTLRF